MESLGIAPAVMHALSVVATFLVLIALAILRVKPSLLTGMVNNPQSFQQRIDAEAARVEVEIALRNIEARLDNMTNRQDTLDDKVDNVKTTLLQLENDVSWIRQKLDV